MTRAPTAALSAVEEGARFGATKLSRQSQQAQAQAAQRLDERIAMASRSAPICNSTTTGTYTGQELRPHCARPGAMDAFALPSLHMGQRTNYQGGYTSGK
jgi:hypothetical protein